MRLSYGDYKAICFALVGFKISGSGFMVLKKYNHHGP